MAWNESVTPDEIHELHLPPVRLCHCTYRIPDGHTVKQPPRPAPAPTRYEWRVFWAAVAVVALAVLIGVLR